MSRASRLSFEFVEYIPEQIADGRLYISTQFATAIHRCCCGCEREVVTPLSPTDWRITFDGVSVSLHPSIGNWSFECQSHYWIRRNLVQWAPRWTRDEIAAGRVQDRKAKVLHFAQRIDISEAEGPTLPTADLPSGVGLLRRFFRWLSG